MAWNPNRERVAGISGRGKLAVMTGKPCDSVTRTLRRPSLATPSNGSQFRRQTLLPNFPMLDEDLQQLIRAILLVVGAILPIVNPLGSAPMFLAMTHGSDSSTR